MTGDAATIETRPMIAWNGDRFVFVPPRRIRHLLDQVKMECAVQGDKIAVTVTMPMEITQ